MTPELNHDGTERNAGGGQQGTGKSHGGGHVVSGTVFGSGGAGGGGGGGGTQKIIHYDGYASNNDVLTDKSGRSFRMVEMFSAGGAGALKTDKAVPGD